MSMHYRQESYSDLKEILKDLEKEREILERNIRIERVKALDFDDVSSYFEKWAEFENHSIHTKIKRIKDEIKRRQGYTVS